MSSLTTNETLGKWKWIVIYIIEEKDVVHSVMLLFIIITIIKIITIPIIIMIIMITIIIINIDYY